jgi:hypothetical protein
MSSFVEQVVGISPYEQKRIDNIKRNNARLRALGLISSLEEQCSNAIACGKYVTSAGNKMHSECAPGTKKQGKRKGSPAEPREGSRKSRRLKAENAVLLDDSNEHLFLEEPMARKREREDRVNECRVVRLRAANAIAACAGEEAAKKNPTATYEHCLMRVKKMTEKGLANRVKAIERSAGKHCVVKMAIFKSCLQDEGMWELAEVASDALERLKALKPFPDEGT